MFSFLDNTKENIRSWALRHAEGPHSKFWLSALSFSEASFFPIPPDVLLIAILLANKARQWLYYAFLTTLFSVLGGVLGYGIGYFFFDLFGQQVISFYGLQSQFVYLKDIFNDTTFWAIFAAAFTPIPYKIFTITAGLFNVNFIVFLIASILGRGIRFFAIGFILKHYGEKIANVLYKYFNIFSFVTLLILIILAYTFL
ncbi:FIG139438: lipoprotein B [hydrothermal vent metagenome]|uniref:FIG139438: lipoprotein B n=1 Tax=hydrothermal vent metagenome TaxID=652676 RepID=A0A3B0T059_9ZZZZ